MSGRRLYLSATRARAAAALLFATLLLAVSQMDAQAQPARTQPFNVVPIHITNVAVVNGQLIAQGLVGNHAFTAPISASATPNAADPTCPILNLHLDPIHVALLGLNVDTSAICLDVVAHDNGGLLGNLLCDIANLLNGGVPLDSILGSLSTSDLTTLTSGLTQLLNQAVFSPLSSSSAFAGAACPVLSLAVGPVDLNLLGLEVSLDNCNSGPVTLDITAVPGAGNLLGNLICALTNLLNGGANVLGALAVLQQIANVISGLAL
jgi:hypothetical protein